MLETKTKRVPSGLKEGFPCVPKASFRSFFGVPIAPVASENDCTKRSGLPSLSEIKARSLVLGEKVGIN
ncbi:Uncharacterised protein [Chlamydia trachomatis]|nr:Uncharacterised protein [Chlamydia trachomatis]